MPQFDLATFSGQMFWLIIVFSLQYFIIAKLVVPGFKALFNRRAKHLGHQLQEAEKLSKKSEELRLDYEQKLEEVKKKHAELLDKASKEIESTSETKLAALEESFIKEVKQREKKLDKAQKDIETAIDEATLDLASGLLNKVAHIKVNKKKLAKYMN